MMKPILVFYIDVNQVAQKDVAKYIEQTSDRTKFKDDWVERIFIPVRDSETRVDCIYPKFVIASSNIKNDMEYLSKSLKDLIDKLNKSTN